MKLTTDEDELNKLLTWCISIVGPCRFVSGDRRFHGRKLVLRLHSASGYHYLNIHRDAAGWAQEVHGLEQWSPAFCGFAPRLLAVHSEEPLALLIDELPGQIMDEVSLSIQHEEEVWQAAGQALAKLHEFAKSPCFGLCQRDGTCVDESATDAEKYVSTQLQRQLEVALLGAYLTQAEVETIRVAQTLLPAFAGEQPVPCHRDYGPANWLVDENGGVWTGVIDFEFAHWDVRVADFTRYPDWQWIHRPDLMAALFSGYGRSLTHQEKIQCIVAHTLYALGAITWGIEHAYYGFADEGRMALQHLDHLLRVHGE